VIKKSRKTELKVEADALLPLIDARQRELCAQSLRLGRRLLREDPAEYCGRLHRYWKLWKQKRPPSSRLKKRPVLAIFPQS